MNMKNRILPFKLTRLTLVVGLAGLGLTHIGYAEVLTNSHAPQTQQNEIDIHAEEASIPLNSIVAIVNSDVLTQSELQNNIDELTARIKLTNQPAPEPSIIRERVLENMVDQQLELQLAQKLGMSIDENTLQTALTQLAAHNKTDLAGLEEIVKREGKSFSQFKEQFRKEMLVSQIQREALARNLVIADKEIDRYLKQHPEIQKSKQEYELQDILVATESTANSSTQKAALARATELKNALESGKIKLSSLNEDNSIKLADFGWRNLATLPNLFSEALVNVSQKNKFIGPVNAPNGYHILHVKDIRGESEAKMISQIHTRHILIRTTDLKTKDEALQEAKDIVDQLNKGQDFAQLARNYSDDINTANKGGDLGWVSPGVMVPQFEKVMMTIPPNVISQPVYTQYGWHIVETLGKRQIDNTDAQIRDEIRNILYKQRFASQLQNWLLDLRSQAFIKINKVE